MNVKRNFECPATGTACEDGSCKSGFCQIEEREQQLLEMQERERQERAPQEIDWDEIVRGAIERWDRMTEEQKAAFAARVNRRRGKSRRLH
jgi:hypothetical protein